MNESHNTKTEYDKLHQEYERLRVENNDLRETISHQVFFNKIIN